MKRAAESSPGAADVRLRAGADAAAAAPAAKRPPPPDISSDLQRYAALPDLPPTLNFLSDSFDAAAALAQPNLLIPVSRVRALDNMSKAAMLLPAQQRRQVVPEDKLPSRPPLTATSEAPKSSKLKDYSRVRTGPVTTETHALGKFHDVFEDMQAMSQGTHSLLFDCLHRNHRVCVVTRGAAGVRGVMTGLISAFDKHCNLVLRDTQEEWALLSPSTFVAPTTADAADAGSDAREARSSETNPQQHGASSKSQPASKDQGSSRPAPLSSTSLAVTAISETAGMAPHSSSAASPSSSSIPLTPHFQTPHWGTYKSPPATISPAQCHLLRHSLLPPLPPGRAYAFVRKSHSQLLLLGNNVVLIYRADAAAPASHAAAELESAAQGSMASADSAHGEDSASKRVKL